MSKVQDWVNDLCLQNEIINTRNLDVKKKEQWLQEFISEFDNNISLETFNRYLREGKEYVREKLGLSKQETTPIKIIPPTKNVGNVLVIGDLHEPFCRKGYREFCYEMKKKHNCETIVFIGDILDQHFQSFHLTDPDTPYGAGTEFEKAKEEIQKWYQLFPKAFITIGNHDALSNRKAFASGVSKRWIKTLPEMLDTPNWAYSDEFTFDDVKYCHGIGRQADSRVKEDMLSCVQGHFHSKSYITHFVGTHKRLFACQIGCGIDDKSFAFAYGKHFSKSHINCAVIKDNGTLPIIEYMDLNKDYTK